MRAFRQELTIASQTQSPLHPGPASNGFHVRSHDTGHLSLLSRENLFWRFLRHRFEGYRSPAFRVSAPPEAVPNHREEIMLRDDTKAELNQHSTFSAISIFRFAQMREKRFTCYHGWRRFPPPLLSCSVVAPAGGLASLLAISANPVPCRRPQQIRRRQICRLIGCQHVGTVPAGQHRPLGTTVLMAVHCFSQLFASLYISIHR
jgi:hypothetical protein